MKKLRNDLKIIYRVIFYSKYQLTIEKNNKIETFQCLRSLKLK